MSIEYNVVYKLDIEISRIVKILKRYCKLLFPQFNSTF